jgi:3-oxoacyl-[acyl-carrier-protein] synthase II
VSRAVVVTGIGVLSAFGVGTDRFWSGLVSGRCPLVANAEGVPVGQVEGLELKTFVRTPGGRRIDHASLLSLAAARLALADAAIDAGALPPARTGLAFGSSLGNLRETPPFMDRVFERGAGNPLVFPNMVMNAPLSYASIELGVTGPTAMTTDGEIAGETAVAWGVRAVADGAVDLCLAGGADEIADILMPVLRTSGGFTRGSARPLDPCADGRALGEGAAVLVLESRERATARGARVYATIRPPIVFGVPAPVHGHARDARPIARRAQAALDGAGVVVASASGLAALDRLEAAVLAATVGARVPVTAPRGALGDFGAAGALAIAAAALTLHDGRVPPTVGCRLPAREGLDVVVGQARASRPRVAVVSGLARGGACAFVRLEGEVA